MPFKCILMFGTFQIHASIPKNSVSPEHNFTNKLDVPCFHIVLVDYPWNDHIFRLRAACQIKTWFFNRTTATNEVFSWFGLIFQYWINDMNVMLRNKPQSEKTKLKNLNGSDRITNCSVVSLLLNTEIHRTSKIDTQGNVRHRTLGMHSCTPTDSGFLLRSDSAPDS